MGGMGDSTSSNSSPTTDSNHMQLATSSGYEVVPKSAVSGVDVYIYGNAGAENDFSEMSGQSYEKYFSGDAARDLLTAVPLDQPQQFTLSGTTTGQIIISYRNGAQEESKTLVIKNQRVLEDPSFPQVHYRSALRLDSHWIGY
jgi:hypothetical protein